MQEHQLPPPAEIAMIAPDEPAGAASAEFSTEEGGSNGVTPASAESPSSSLTVDGTTEPATGRFAKLPLATAEPIAFVDVQVGDRVQKGWQVFSHWESPQRLEAVKNEYEKSQKLLEVADARLMAAEQVLARLEKLPGTVSSQELQDARTMATIRKAEREAADLAMQESENRFTAKDFEFKQAFVTSPIEGIVATVDVVAGERRQLGNQFRGVTVLDPRVLSCRCLLAPEQAKRVAQAIAEKRTLATVEFDARQWNATVKSIGVMADSRTHRIPVLLEIQNPDESLPCGIPVIVRFPVPDTVKL